MAFPLLLVLAEDSKRVRLHKGGTEHSRRMVERSDTHRLVLLRDRMGIAALHPSYGTG